MLRRDADAMVEAGRARGLRRTDKVWGRIVERERAAGAARALVLLAMRYEYTLAGVEAGGLQAPRGVALTDAGLEAGLARLAMRHAGEPDLGRPLLAYPAVRAGVRGWILPALLGYRALIRVEAREHWQRKLRWAAKVRARLIEEEEARIRAEQAAVRQGVEEVEEM